MNRETVIVIGAGPAGLTAAYELLKRDVKPIVLEKTPKVGGMARTEIHKGYRFDIGGHRFFTDYDDIQRIWEELLEDDLLVRTRRSRVYFDGRFFRYPLDLFDVLSNLGISESFRILLSYFKARINPIRQEKTFEDWVSNRFGSRLFHLFFKPYTEKVWGIPCDQLEAEMAKERIQGLSLASAISNAFFGTQKARTLISRFYYPVLGPGMMWQRFQDHLIRRGAEIRLNSDVIRINRDEKAVKSVTVQQEGKTSELTGSHIISSMPLSELVAHIHPAPPAEVLAAAGKLRYRDFLIVGLIVDRKTLFQDQWIYVHSPEVKVGRIQNFKNWSVAMVGDPDKTSLGMEYFCVVDDDLWEMADDELIGLASSELVRLGFTEEEAIEEGVVFRQPKAYPVYERHYQRGLNTIQRYLMDIRNITVIGRNGLHHYHNQDHSMYGAMAAVKQTWGKVLYPGR